MPKVMMFGSPLNYAGQRAEYVKFDPNEDITSNTVQSAIEELGDKVSTATTDSVGVVKPDGTTISIDEDGTIHGSSTMSESELTTIWNNVFTGNVTYDSDDETLTFSNT